MPEFSVVFYERDFGNKITVEAEISVDRYSWNMKGGPERATLKALVKSDKWSLMKLLRCPVEIYGINGKVPVWYGYVNKVSIPHGASMVGKGLDEMANYVDVYYGSEFLGAASDAESISEYGQKEKQLSLYNATEAEATQAQSIYLAERGYPRPETGLSGGSDEIEIECYGWWESLDWKHYLNASESNVEHTTQIDAIVTSAGQFIADVLIEDTAGITSNEERDGRSGAGYLVEQLLDAGTTNIRPLLAYVDKDRYLHVYERDAKPNVTDAPYLLRDDGNIETKLGSLVVPQECKVGVWVWVKGVPAALESIMPPFFIERAEYSARQDTVTYQPAGAFEQVRLAKWVADIAGTDGASRSFPGYTPSAGGSIIAAGAYLRYAYNWSSDTYSILGSNEFPTPVDEDIELPAGTGLYLLTYWLHIEETGIVIDSAAYSCEFDFVLTYPGSIFNDHTTCFPSDDFNPLTDGFDVQIVRIFEATGGETVNCYWFGGTGNINYDNYSEVVNIIKLG